MIYLIRLRVIFNYFGGIMNFFNSKRNQRIIAAVIALVVAAAMVVTSISFF